MWVGASGPASFEFYYDKPRAEGAVRWDEEAGLRFFQVDDGESNVLANRTPIVLERSSGDPNLAALRFEQVAARVESAIYRFVLTRIWAD